MSIKAKEVDRMWKKLDFDIEKARDVKATFVVDGKIVLRTRRSHGARKLDGQIPNLIRQQMRLSSSEFSEALACPLEKNGYIAILKDKGLI